MKIALIFVVLTVAFCVIAGDSQKEPASQDGGGSSNKTETSSTTASPQRPRRSPPRFDANKMKGKYAKSNKIKGLLQDLGFEKGLRQERSVADYLSPIPALLYAAQPPAAVKSQGTTPSA